MRYLYKYNSKENERRDGEISASSVDAVYRELKKRGIKPYKVCLAPGIFNKLLSVGRRWLAIGLLTIVVVCMTGLWIGIRDTAAEYRDRAEVFRDRAEAFADRFENKTRRQVIGDTAIIEKGIRFGWSDVFAEEGERFLASFAIPGVSAGQRNTTEEEIRAALSRQIAPVESDGIEARQIKAMVEGMKDELREFLRDGGSIKEFGNCLVDRQETEIAIYKRIETEVLSAQKTLTESDFMRLYEKRNDELRNLGLRTLALPE